MNPAETPSVHRAMFVASAAATLTFFALPASLAVIAALGASDTGIAIGFTGFIALAFGPWIFLAAYLGAVLAVFGARAIGVDVLRVSRRTHQTVGIGMATALTLLASLVTNEVGPVWLLFTLPAGFVAGSVFFRRSRRADQ